MPVWDRFLTLRDKQHLRRSALYGGPHRPLGRSPALVVVDIYYDVLGKRPEDLLAQVRHLPAGCGLEAWNALSRTKDLIRVARRAEVPIIYTVNDTGSVAGSLGRIGRERASRMPRPPLAQRIPRTIAPRRGDVVITKGAPSAFFGTQLAACLTALRVDTVLVCGETTSGCVRATVVDGATLRFVMAVVEECTFDRTEAAHAMSLFDIHMKYGRVMRHAAATDYLSRHAERVRARSGARAALLKP